MIQPWEISPSLCMLASSVLCPKAVNTASCTIIAVPQEHASWGQFLCQPHDGFPLDRFLNKIRWLQGFCFILQIFSHSSLLTQSWVMSPAGKGEKTLYPDFITGRSSQWNINKSCWVVLVKLPWWPDFPPSCCPKMNVMAGAPAASLGPWQKCKENLRDLGP